VELCAQWPHIPTSSHGTQTTTEDVSKQTRNAWRVAAERGGGYFTLFQVVQALSPILHQLGCQEGHQQQK